MIIVLAISYHSEEDNNRITISSIEVYCLEVLVEETFFLVAELGEDLCSSRFTRYISDLSAVVVETEVSFKS